MLLESKSKFDLRSPSKERTFSPDQFFVWSNKNMYRTSYGDMGFLKVVWISYHSRVRHPIRTMFFPSTWDIFQAKQRTTSLVQLTQRFQDVCFLLISLTSQVPSQQLGNYVV